MVEQYYPLINKVFNTLSLKDKLRDTFAKPFVTFSRDPGSGGAPIAKAVADKLGFTFIDKQIIEHITESTKQRHAIVKAVDERSRTKIEDMVHSLLNQEYFDDVKYFQELVTIILVYAHNGRVVILGRGANFITPGNKGLHVRVTAPLDVRIKRAMDYEGFNKEQARQTIRKKEEERRKFVHQYFDKDIADAQNYDLVVNTAQFSIEEASEVIVTAFYRKFSRLRRYSNIF
jgi:cytidylate kinase